MDMTVILLSQCDPGHGKDVVLDAVCVSQDAEGFARLLGDGVLQVSPLAIVVCCLNEASAVCHRPRSTP